MGEKNNNYNCPLTLDFPSLLFLFPFFFCLLLSVFFFLSTYYKGIPDYNTLRTGLGLSKIQKWSEITTNQDVVLKLITLYGDDGYNNMDAFVGGLAEDHVKGGSVGELFATIIADQFYRLRNGDRHWYENVGVSGNTALIPRIQKYATMKQVVERNSNLSNDEKVWDGHRSGEKSAFLV